MKQPIPEQLDKILALADSSHEAEAVVAVRKARQILSQSGLSFSDLAQAATKGPFSGQRHALQTQIDYLQQQITDMQDQMRTQDLQLDFWRRRARDLENAQRDADRWKKLARDTVEKLWDVGQSIRGDEFVAPAPVAARQK